MLGTIEVPRSALKCWDINSNGQHCTELCSFCKATVRGSNCFKKIDEINAEAGKSRHGPLLKIKNAPMLDISVHFAISKEMKIVTGKEVAK